MANHKQLLLGRAQADKQHIRIGRVDFLHHRGLILKIAVGRSADGKARVFFLQILTGPLRDTGLAAQQIEPSAGFT